MPEQEAQSTGRGWNPVQYDRFRDERRQPFYDLTGLVQREPGMRVVDLGCGTGELTAWLHGEIGAAETLGVDHSDAMLADSAAFVGPGVRFEKADILDFVRAHRGEFDLVFSNAALQWVTGHETIIPKVLELAKPGGQVALQMPSNLNHTSHRLAAEIAGEEPFRTALDGWLRHDPVQTAEWYADLLHRAGLIEMRVRLEVYPHLLTSTRGIVEWVKGSLLTAYTSRLPEDLVAPFLQRYEQVLVERLGYREPFFYAFPRILLWGRLLG
jgi:trans-aconitate 2-methyltransferase